MSTSSPRGSTFFKNIFERVRQHNYIAIGGPFGVGKSSLTIALAKALNLQPVLEIDENDAFTSAIMTAQYSKTDTWIEGTSNEWFAHKRYETHEHVARTKNGYVCDGTIFQSPVISNIMDAKSNQNAFESYVRELCEKVAYRIGIPKLYIILKAPWPVVKERILTRGRPYEIEYFQKNERDFKKLTNRYAGELQKQCERYRIPYLVVDARLSLDEQIQLIRKYLLRKNITVVSGKRDWQYMPLVRSNVVAVGGMVGAGKSTLTCALAKHLQCEQMQELKDNDPWHNAFLSEFYSASKPYIKQMFQSYMPQYRIKAYKAKLAQTKGLLVIDRTIFEDRIFASFSIKEKKALKYYNRVWYEMANDLAYKTGMPRLYVLLDMPFAIFEKRIFDRGRPAEIDSFDKNREYFKKLGKNYVEKLVELCERFEINYLILDASMPTHQQVQRVMQELKALGVVDLAQNPVSE